MKHIETAVAKRLETAATKRSANSIYVDSGVIQAIESSMRVTSPWRKENDTWIAQLASGQGKQLTKISKQLIIQLHNSGPSLKYEVEPNRKQTPGAFVVRPKKTKEGIPERHNIKIQVDLWRDVVTISSNA